MSRRFPLITLILVIQGFISGSLQFSYAQTLLEIPVSVTVNRQPLANVLSQISAQGNFYFSYSSDVFRSDSLVTLSVVNTSVRHTLDQIFGGKIRYKASEGYIFLLPKNPEKQLIISGKLIDKETLLPVDYASVYSRGLLVSDLSDELGNFRLRIRDHTLPQEITVSKIGYQDTTLLVTHAFRQNPVFALTPKAIDLDGVVIMQLPGYRNFLMKLLVSSRLRMTSQNLGRFFVNLPYQASLTPGLGTHGKMASQIVNKLSLNLIGGYTAGTNGVEMAGVFNISKWDVRYVQAAGMINLVAGKSEGIQMAGIHNSVQDSVLGIQAAGFSNIAGSHIRGIQISGVMNKSDGIFSGIQMTGGLNLARQSGNGIQAAGLFNHNKLDFAGIQAAGFFNYTRRNFKGIQMAPINSVKSLKGLQVGIVNRAEYSEGYSLGIFNFIKNGNPHFSLSSTDIALLSLSWKTGMPGLYTVLTAGAHPVPDRKRMVWGVGLGREWKMNKKIVLQTEAIQLNVAQKNQVIASLLRIQMPVNYFINSRLSLFAGPSLSLVLAQKRDNPNHSFHFPDPFHKNLLLANNPYLWLGGQVGMSWYYGRNFTNN